MQPKKLPPRSSWKTAVHHWAEKTIAHYALPRQLVVIAELPRNQMGKILRRKVAQLVRERLGRE